MEAHTGQRQSSLTEATVNPSITDLNRSRLPLHASSPLPPEQGLPLNHWGDYNPQLLSPITSSPSRQRNLLPGEKFILRKSGSGRFYQNAGRVNSEHPAVGRYDFIIEADNPHAIYISPEQSEEERKSLSRRNMKERGHVSLSENKSVIYAGIIQFDNNSNISHWSNNSGHYRTPRYIHTKNIPPALRNYLEIGKYRPART